MMALVRGGGDVKSVALQGDWEECTRVPCSGSR